MENWFMKTRIWLALLCIFTLLAAGCVSRNAFHSFQINGRLDGRPNAEGKYEGWGKEVDLLEYRYGDHSAMARDSLISADGPNRYVGKMSLPLSLNGVKGIMPVGDFLYVKWRIRATGEILEDRVDLRDRLPVNMDNHIITFVPDGEQLRVFVETPFLTPKHGVHSYQKKRTHLTSLSAYYKTYEIYPSLEPYPGQSERCVKQESLCAAEQAKK